MSRFKLRDDTKVNIVFVPLIIFVIGLIVWMMTTQMKDYLREDYIDCLTEKNLVEHCDYLHPWASKQYERKDND